MSVPSEHYRFTDDANATAAIQEFYHVGVQGFTLLNNDHNKRLITEAVGKIGYWNGVVIRHVVNELMKILEWKDNNKLSDGTDRLGDNPSEFELQNATPAQIKAHLQSKRVANHDETKKYDWQLDLYRTDRKILQASTPQQIKDWIGRRQKAGLSTAV